MNKNCLVSFLVIILAYSCGKDSVLNHGITEEVILVEHKYLKNKGPEKNPLKGFNSGWWNNYEYASVGFQYLKWNDFEPVNDVFDFNYLEKVTSRPGTSGRHLILRLYCDWYGEDEVSDGPDWLYSEQGVARLKNANGKYVTDFNDPNFINEAIQAIEQLINYYDNDPRIYSLQIGILGYWGEWHTYGYGETFNISENSKEQILDTFKSKTKLINIMGRYPWREPLSSSGGIGYHNDYFKPVNHSYEFDDAINDNNLWLEGPIGGEVPPDVLNTEYEEMYSSPKGLSMIETGHYSTMQARNPPCNNLPAGNACEGFMLMHRKMGYNYQIEKAIFPDTLSKENQLNIHLKVNNIGVAHMYHDWNVQFAIIDEYNSPLEIHEVKYDLTKALSMKSFDLKKSIDKIPQGNHKIGIRIIQPMADKPKSESWGLDARNTYILFSNEMELIHGSWNSDNLLVGGWSILGKINVK